MTVTIRPSAPSGSVAAPPSKSAAHRLLLCAGLAAGESVVHGVAPSEDVLATMDCLRALGAACRFDGDTARVDGTGLLSGTETLLCRESGSTLRFFVPLCLLDGRERTLAGSERLLERPLGVYEDICRERGMLFEKSAASLRLAGRLTPGTYELPGDVSSQFVSGLLFALPRLGGDSLIRLRPPVESRAYIDMTTDALRTFGVETRRRDETTIEVPGNQAFAPREAAVEGDWSNAAFFLALGAEVTGLREDSVQGDRVCVSHLARLREGAAEIDLSDCPDLGPVLFAYAAAHHGGTFTGARRLRLKESDRVETMRAELAKFGVSVTAEGDRVRVGSGLRAPAEALCGHNDHRVVMALCVLCAKTGGVIEGAEAVNKSFPDFFEKLRTLDIEVEGYGMDQQK